MARKSEIQCTIRVRDSDQLCASLRAARRAGPGSRVVSADGIVLAVVVACDESAQKPMLEAYKTNNAIYAAHPELMARYHQRPRRQSPNKSRGAHFVWCTMGGDHRKRRAATLAREKAEREAMGVAA